MCVYMVYLYDYYLGFMYALNYEAGKIRKFAI